MARDDVCGNITRGWMVDYTVLSMAFRGIGGEKIVLLSLLNLAGNKKSSHAYNM